MEIAAVGLVPGDSGTLPVIGVGGWAASGTTRRVCCAATVIRAATIWHEIMLVLKHDNLELLGIGENKSVSKRYTLTLFVYITIIT